MLDLILDPTLLTIVLILLAIATPILAWYLGPHLGGKRQTWALGGSGPVILALWGVHNLVLETVGFASIWSLLLLLLLAIAVGASAGWWLADESQDQTKG